MSIRFYKHDFVFQQYNIIFVKWISVTFVLLANQQEESVKIYLLIFRLCWKSNFI